MTQSRAVRIVKRGRLHVAVPIEPGAPLTDEIVRETMRGVREREHLASGPSPIQPPRNRRRE